jgi:putative membrane protein
MVLTLGLFAVVIDAVLLYVTPWLTSLDIENFGGAVLGSILLSVVTFVMDRAALRARR